MSILIGILCLGFLVFFHESGHFIAARICGVKVESFSIGMGPILLHRKYKDTDYRLSLIPLGGYCGMKGEQDFQKAIEQNLSSIKSDSDSFYGVHPLKRALIAFAGPLFNYIFSIIAFSVIAMVGYSYYSASAKVRMADELYTDTISTAHEAGLQTGDVITSINGKSVNDFSDIVETVSIHPDEMLSITVDRNGESLSFNVKSVLNKDTGSGRIGVVSYPDTVQEKHSKTYSFFPAFVQGFKETNSMIKATVTGICSLFKGVKITNAVSGPARITTMLGDTVKLSFKTSIKVGITNTLQFMALISVSLCFMNLLPIPILDGGIILVAFIECISRKKPNPKVLYYIQFIGIAFIAVLFAIAMYGDFHYFFIK